MSEKIYWVAGDNNRTLVYRLVLGEPFDLTDQTIICRAVPDRKTGGEAIEITNVIPAADQSTDTGVCTTSFDSSEIVYGIYSLEWETTDVNGTIVTFPGPAAQRPTLIVRKDDGPPTS